MSAKLAAALCWLAAGVAYLGLEAVAARAVPGYRYSHDFISDLGRPDSPLSHLMNTAFVVQGTLFLAGVALVVRTGSERGSRSRVFVALAALNALGNLIVASVPSGQGGSAWLHVTGAVLAIAGGNAAIVAGSRLTFARSRSPALRQGSMVMGAIGLLGFAALAVNTTTALPVVLPAATLERLSVYTITGWELIAAVALLLPTGRRG